VVIAVICAGGITAAVRHGGAGSRPPHPAPAASVRVSPAGAGVPRLAEIRALLRRRSAAIVGHDRAAFMATIDPTASGFRRSQARMFTDLAVVRFADWSYRVGRPPAVGDGRLSARYGAAAWAPARFALHYRIAGFDPAPTDLRQYPTFVERSGRWYLASLSAFGGRGEISATDLWDFGPVREVRRGSVLVLGPPAQRHTMAQVATLARAAVPRVSAVWGSRWSRRVVIQVPASQHEMGLITGDDGDLDQIAAVTSAEVSATNGRPRPVGDRVTINPRTWPRLDPVGAAVVLTHELTHVASRADTGSQTPKWLSEGFADYVGFRGSGLPVTVVAAELMRQVRAGRLARHLPTDAEFAGSARLPLAYEAGWLACRYVAAHYGQRALVRLYRSVGTSPHSRSRAVTTAMRRVLGLTPGQFTARWRRYVRGQLA
jgi:hypothetical protein